MKKIKFGLGPRSITSLGIQSHSSSWDIEGYRQLLLELEELGYYSINLVDHLSNNRLEGWTTLSILGSLSDKIRLGHTVLCNSLRNPALLANMAATLDILTKGRFELGLGAGWTKSDYDTCGLPYSKASIRITQSEEAVQIIKKMWTEEETSFEGKYYWIKDARCPKPVQNPHPPIMIGGGGERLLLRVVAKHADVCFPTFSFSTKTGDIQDSKRQVFRTLEECKHKLNVLRKHCRAVGRDWEDIEKAWAPRILIARTKKEAEEDLKQIRNRNPRFDYQGEVILGSPDECIQKINEFVEIGIEYFYLGFSDLPDRKGLRLFAEEVIPNFT